MPTYQQEPYDGLDDSFPALIAFDLDYTLWSGWVDTHYAGEPYTDDEAVESVRPQSIPVPYVPIGPLRRPSPAALNAVLDRNDKRLSLYPAIPRILHRLQGSQTITLAATSRTTATDMTRDALALLLVPPPKERTRERPQRAIDFFDYLEVYPDSKRVHFSELHKKTSIPYSAMLFFAGDTSELPSNTDVQQLGVTFIPVNPKTGVTETTVEEGIREWRRRRKARGRVQMELGDYGDEGDEQDSDESGSTW